MRAGAREDASVLNSSAVCDNFRDISLDNASTILVGDVSANVDSIAHASTGERHRYGARSSVCVRVRKNAHHFVGGCVRAVLFCHERDSLRATQYDPIVAPRIRARLKTKASATVRPGVMVQSQKCLTYEQRFLRTT